MKTFVLTALVALTSTVHADQGDASAESQRLSLAARTKLRGQVVLSKLFLKELRAKQWLMNSVNAEHSNNPKTIALGAVTGATEIAAGLASIKALSMYELTSMNKRVRYYARQIIEQNRLAKTEAEKAAVAKDADRAAHESRVAINKGNAEQYVGDLRKLRRSRPGLQAERFVRVGIGGAIASLVIIDGVESLVQISFLPQDADALEARLTSFVNDAEQTLAER